MTTTQECFSWLGKDVLPPVANQGISAACHAFTAAAAISANLAINKRVMFECSKQELIDCVVVEYPGEVGSLDERTGCFHGKVSTNLKYVKRFGIANENDYAWEGGRPLACRRKTEKQRVSIRDYKFVDRINGMDDDLKRAIRTSPVGGVMTCDAARLNLHTGPGVYMQAEAVAKAVSAPRKTLQNHAVLVIGYGELNGIKYYEIQNSWGTRWCNGGYGKIKADLFSDVFVEVVEAYLKNV